jgi:hypothetical protein
MEYVKEQLSGENRECCLLFCFGLSFAKRLKQCVPYCSEQPSVPCFNNFSVFLEVIHNRLGIVSLLCSFNVELGTLNCSLKTAVLRFWCKKVVPFLLRTVDTESALEKYCCLSYFLCRCTRTGPIMGSPCPSECFNYRRVRLTSKELGMYVNQSKVI